MESRSPQAGGGPQYGADEARTAEGGQSPARQAAASAAPAKETRSADVALTTDGQLAEAGYGHGV